MISSEHNRLAELDSYNILHSAQEKLFDDLAELAAYIFSVPVARIAFVHRQGVWHKASVGMPAQETIDLEQSLCPRAIKADEPVLVYTDLAALPQASTDTARERQVRFYAGAPLRTSAGHCIGTVCLAGYEPRQFTEAEQQLLQQLSGLVVQALEARRYLLTAHTPAEWELLRQDAEEALHNQMAVVRYLKARSEGQVPVPSALLEPISRRLVEVAEVFSLGRPPEAPEGSV